MAESLSISRPGDLGDHGDHGDHGDYGDHGYHGDHGDHGGDMQQSCDKSIILIICSKPARLSTHIFIIIAMNINQ